MTDLRAQTLRRSSTATAALVLVAGLLTGGALCEGDPFGGFNLAAGDSPEAVGLKTKLDYVVEPGGAGSDGNDGSSLRDRLLNEIEGADRRIWAAATADVLDDEIAGALVDAHDRGVDVRLVADVDHQSDSGFAQLREADIPITWGNGELNYLPDPNLGQILTNCVEHEDRNIVECAASGDDEQPCTDPAVPGDQGTMCRPGSYNRMSHRFFIVDDRTVWNLAAGFGDGEAGNLGWRARSEYLREDFVREFRQMEGGVFATELDAFNGPIKSTTDANVDYLTDRGVLQVRFNPQERLLKHVVDEIYRAKQSIQIVTESLTNPFVLDALESKAGRGFDIEVVVGADTQPAGEARQRLATLGAQALPDGDQLPTVVVTDDLAGNSDRNWPRTALVLTHPLWHGAPFSVLPPENPDEEDASDRVHIYPSDHFVDGNMWRLREFSTQPDDSPQIGRIGEYAADAIERGSDLSPNL